MPTGREVDCIAVQKELTRIAANAAENSRHAARDWLRERCWWWCVWHRKTSATSTAKVTSSAVHRDRRRSYSDYAWWFADGLERAGSGRLNAVIASYRRPNEELSAAQIAECGSAADFSQADGTIAFRWFNPPGTQGE